MNKSKRRKAKFKVGQVVCDDNTVFTKIVKRYRMGGDKWYYDLDVLFRGNLFRVQIAESALRPLTKREQRG